MLSKDYETLILKLFINCRIRSRVSNLGDEKNPDFISLVLSGNVPADMVAKMSPEVRNTLMWTAGLSMF